MSVEKRVYTGKEVADAIKKACEDLGVPQERLQIEIIATGSTGIFGLIRKKAKIEAFVKEEEPEVAPVATPAAKAKSPRRDSVATKNVKESRKPEKVTASDTDPTAAAPSTREPLAVAEELSEESVALVKEVLTELLNVMQMPSEVKVSAEGIEVLCKIEGDFEETLTGQDGKTLDSLQYLLRKMIARKTVERIKLSVDVGEFRLKRKENLKEKAAELAQLVKEDGKTQVIPALNPSERRVVHMVLQDDKEIRSRSVGDGLFKKVLIYKPGKGSKGDGRRRQNNKGRRTGKGGNRKNNSSEQKES